MNTKCIFGFHKWVVHPDKACNVVSKPYWGDMPKDFKPNGEVIYTLHRICSCCGKRQW